MRIGFVVGQFPQLSETFVIGQMAGLLQRGFAVEVVCNGISDCNLANRQQEPMATLLARSRDWWGAARAVVLAEPGGVWAATWGESEDDPDYVTVATIEEFEPPARMVLTDFRYRAKSGPLPFESTFVTAFTVRPAAEGAILRVSQEGFPAGPEGDEFLASCELGWRDTFAGIRRCLQGTAESA